MIIDEDKVYVDGKERLQACFDPDFKYTIIASLSDGARKRKFAEFKDLWNSLYSINEGRYSKAALFTPPDSEGNSVWCYEHWRDANEQIIIETIAEHQKRHNWYNRLVDAAGKSVV